MKTYLPQNFALAFGLALAIPAALVAQTTTPIAPPAVEGPIVKLDTFTVNTEKDVGYTAVDSLAGGRNNTPVRITPTAVSSLTSQFIDDLQLTDVKSALRWTLNAAPVNFTGGHGGN